MHCHCIDHLVGCCGRANAYAVQGAFQAASAAARAPAENAPAPGRPSAAAGKADPTQPASQANGTQKLALCPQPPSQAVCHSLWMGLHSEFIRLFDELASGCRMTAAAAATAVALRPHQRARLPQPSGVRPTPGLVWVSGSLLGAHFRWQCGDSAPQRAQRRCAGKRCAYEHTLLLHASAASTCNGIVCCVWTTTAANPGKPTWRFPAVCTAALLLQSRQTLQFLCCRRRLRRVQPRQRRWRWRSMVSQRSGSAAPRQSRKRLVQRRRQRHKYSL